MLVDQPTTSKQSPDLENPLLCPHQTDLYNCIDIGTAVTHWTREVPHHLCIITSPLQTHYITLHITSPLQTHYITLHITSPLCITDTLYYVTLHLTTSLQTHYITLHYT